ncbi:MAG: methyltransferase domain-containing protein [Candidatus Micrarchaeaceae archaeon]
MGLLDLFLKKHKLAEVQIGNDRVEVYDWGYERVVKFNGVVYSRLNSGSIYTHEYWDFFLPMAFASERPRLLMIGLGGGTIAYQLDRLLGSRISIEAVEINKEMIEVMGRFIGESLNLKVTVGDGAEYLANKKGSYDAIILDAYINDRIPERFLENQFIESAASALSEGGLLGINFIKSSNGYPTFDAYVALLKRSFKVFSIHTGFFTGNTVLLCSKKYGKELLLERINRNFVVNKDNSFIIEGYALMKEL